MALLKENCSIAAADDVRPVADDPKYYFVLSSSKTLLPVLTPHVLQSQWDPSRLLERLVRPREQ
jgi:hypothetical protein